MLAQNLKRWIGADPIPYPVSLFMDLCEWIVQKKVRVVTVQKQSTKQNKTKYKKKQKK